MGGGDCLVLKLSCMKPYPERGYRVVHGSSYTCPFDIGCMMNMYSYQTFNWIYVLVARAPSLVIEEQWLHNVRIGVDNDRALCSVLLFVDQ